MFPGTVLMYTASLGRRTGKDRSTVPVPPRGFATGVSELPRSHDLVSNAGALCPIPSYFTARLGTAQMING